MPTREFNIVFPSCAHIQALIRGRRRATAVNADYYYVLRSTPVDRTMQKDAVTLLNAQGMMHFARAVMWVLQEVYGNGT